MCVSLVNEKIMSCLTVQTPVSEPVVVSALLGVLCIAAGPAELFHLNPLQNLPIISAAAV